MSRASGVNTTCLLTMPPPPLTIMTHRARLSYVLALSLVTVGLIWLIVPKSRDTGHDQHFSDFRRDVRSFAASYAPSRSSIPDSLFESYRLGANGIAAKPLSTSEFNRASVYIKGHIERRYEADDVLKQVNSIMLCGRLSIDGYVVSGTHTPTAIYISIKSSGYKVDRELSDQATFDHELASVLYFANIDHFPTDEWIAINCPDIKYGKGGLDAVKRGVQYSLPTEGYLQCGFTSEYATASVREDVCGIAVLVFSTPDRAWVWWDKYPRIRKKIVLYGQFLKGLDGHWYERYCQSLGTAEGVKSK